MILKLNMILKISFLGIINSRKFINSFMCTLPTIISGYIYNKCSISGILTHAYNFGTWGGGRRI